MANNLKEFLENNDKKALANFSGMLRKIRKEKGLVCEERVSRVCGFVTVCSLPNLRY